MVLAFEVTLALSCGERRGERRGRGRQREREREREREKRGREKRDFF